LKTTSERKPEITGDFMRHILILTLVFSLSACAAPSVVPTLTLPATLTPPPTKTPSPFPTSTETPTATEIPVPAELKNLPPGVTAESNGDGTWKITLKSGNQTEALGTFNPATGFSIAFSDGSTTNIKAEEVGSFQAGKDSPFQIYNKTGDKITYAYDAENKVWIDAATVLQSDKTNPDNYIKIQTWDDLEKLARLEKMVLPPFPDNTYWPDPSKIIADYNNTKINNDRQADFNWYHALGRLDDLTKSPFRFVNFSFLPKGEGRPSDVYIITEQVYNPDDGSFSLLHFTSSVNFFL
jgi:hypothetical protein